MKNIYSICLTVCLVFFLGCSQAPSAEKQKPATDQPAAEHPIWETVGPAVFEAKMNHISDEILIDLRTSEEIEETGIIAGAIHMNYFDNDINKRLNELDRNTPIMVYCNSGGRSDRIATVLNRFKFKAVYDLKGGISDWISSGKPVEPYKATNNDNKN